MALRSQTSQILIIVIKILFIYFLQYNIDLRGICAGNRGVSGGDDEGGCGGAGGGGDGKLGTAGGTDPSI